MYKIKTPFGYLELADERMAENAKTMHKDMSQDKHIDIKTVYGSSSQPLYTEKTPFGVMQTSNINTAFQARAKKLSSPEKKIDIKTIH